MKMLHGFEFRQFPFHYGLLMKEKKLKAAIPYILGRSLRKYNYLGEHLTSLIFVIVFKWIVMFTPLIKKVFKTVVG